LRQIAAALGGTPNQVTTPRLTRLLDDHPASARTVKSLRLTLRAFYSWAETAGIVTASPMPARAPITRYRVSDRWQDALQAFESGQGRAGVASTTIAQRVKHITRLAADVDRGPWELDGPEIRDWLEALPGGDSNLLSHRVSVRAFYRWAYSAQLVTENPTDLDAHHKLRLPVPSAWAYEINAYARAQRAEGRPETTISTRRMQLERLARDHSRRSPYELTLDDLLEWLSVKRWASETRRGNRTTVGSFYRWAESTGRVDASPADGMPRVRPSQPRPRPALEHDVAHALAISSPRDRLAVQLAAELGLRRAEVAQVHTRDITKLPGDEQWWLLIHGKGSRERRVPLTHNLASTLRALPSGWAFPSSRGGHLSPRYLGKRVSQLLPEGVTTHALRHRFATRAYNIDRDVFAVQHFLGHASPASTQRYVLVADMRLRALGEAVTL
jgi:site-specific recombinase XerD